MLSSHSGPVHLFSNQAIVKSSWVRIPQKAHRYSLKVKHRNVQFRKYDSALFGSNPITYAKLKNNKNYVNN